ncbi:hypothetical protein GTPT_1212 [Tatumella ptyseos ATCC 33301]|uniref:Uncharacterized protein n=1 Tax=Tatumella ptyseos ATCC 33301 TaxID=1005995 RepID=A0A085JJN3_9GAMM|nr:hypothetical protein GTPT_1212 [Tatumella ptyseos ATCC 33301]
MKELKLIFTAISSGSPQTAGEVRYLNRPVAERTPQDT